MNKEKSSAPFVSLSVFLHVGALLGLAIVPALKLLPSGGDPVEMTMDDSSFTQTVAQTQTAPVQSEMPVQQPIEPVQVVAKKAPAPAKKVEVKQETKKSALPLIEPLHQEEDAIAEVQTEAENFAKEATFMKAADEVAAQATQESIEEQVAEDVAENAAAEAVREEPTEEPKEEALAAPIVQPVVQRLQEVQEIQEQSAQTETQDTAAAAGAGNGLGAGSASGSGASVEDARSHLDLKQKAGNRPPQYPIQQRRNGQQGEVILSYFVTQQGAVKDVRITKSSGVAELDREAARAIAQYKYVAGQEGWTEHPVVFSLKGAAAPAPGRLRISGQGAGP